jgi:hypothetical protein
MYIVLSVDFVVVETLELKFLIPVKVKVKLTTCLSNQHAMKTYIGGVEV